MSLDPRDRRRGHVIGILHARMGRGSFEDGVAGREEDVLHLRRERLVEVLSFLKDDPDADLSLLVDVTAVEDDAAAGSALALHYRLRSPRLGYRLRAVVDLDPEEPSAPSLAGLFSAADWLERECHEMFGVYFDGHPHLRPLLLYTGFAGHPLRRGYPAAKAQPLVALSSPDDPPVVVDAGFEKEREP